jgi:hypothetical protein
MWTVEGPDPRQLDESFFSVSGVQQDLHPSSTSFPQPAPADVPSRRGLTLRDPPTTLDL